MKECNLLLAALLSTQIFAVCSEQSLPEVQVTEIKPEDAKGGLRRLLDAGVLQRHNRGDRSHVDGKDGIDEEGTRNLQHGRQRGHRSEPAGQKAVAKKTVAKKKAPTKKKTPTKKKATRKKKAARKKTTPATQKAQASRGNPGAPRGQRTGGIPSAQRWPEIGDDTVYYDDYFYYYDE